MKRIRIPMDKFRVSTANFLVKRRDMIIADGELLLYLDSAGDDGNLTYTLKDEIDKYGIDDISEDSIKIIDELTKEVIYYALYEHFLSIPEAYTNRFYKICKLLIFDSYNVNDVLWAKTSKYMGRGCVCGESIDFDDVIGFFNPLITEIMNIINPILPDNEWLAVDVDFGRINFTLTLGDDIRITKFHERYGDGRWEGNMVDL